MSGSIELGSSGPHTAPDCNESLTGHRELLHHMQEEARQSEVLIPAFMDIVKTRIEHNDSLVLPPGQKFITNISVADFLGRIVKYSNASPCCYAVALIWLEKTKKKSENPEKPLLTSANYQRIILTAVMVANKFLDDLYYSNKHWAQIGGISTAEVNKMELEFLEQINFKLHIQREEYDWYCEELFQHAKTLRVSPPPIAAPTQPARRHSAFTVTNVGHAVPAPSKEDKSKKHSQPLDDDALSARTTPSSSVTKFDPSHTVPHYIQQHQHHQQHHFPSLPANHMPMPGPAQMPSNMLPWQAGHAVQHVPHGQQFPFGMCIAPAPMVQQHHVMSAPQQVYFGMR